MDRGTWQATVHRVTQSRTRLSTIAHMHSYRILSFKRNYYTIFQNGFTILHSYQEYVSDPLCARPRQHLMMSLVFILTVLLAVQWCLIVVLTCASVMNTPQCWASFMCLFDNFMYSSKRYLLMSFASFLIGLFFCWILKVFKVHSTQ